MLAVHVRFIVRCIIFLLLMFAFIAIEFRLRGKPSNRANAAGLAALLAASLCCSAMLSHIIAKSFDSVWTVFEEPDEESDGEPNAKPDEGAVEKKTSTSNSGPGHDIEPDTGPDNDIGTNTGPGHDIEPDTGSGNNTEPNTEAGNRILIDIESEPFSEDELDIEDEPVPLAPVPDP